MKNFRVPALHRERLFLAICLLLCSFFSQAQTFVGESSSPADNGSQAGPTAIVTPPAGMMAGDLVVIYAHYRATGTTLSMSATGGQVWINETSDNGNNQTFNIFWCRYNGSWTGNPSVTVGAGGNALTATMYVFRPTSATRSWGVHVAAANSSSAATNDNTINGYNTTVPNTVTMAFWGNAAASVWNDLSGTGWTKAGLDPQYRNTSGADQSHTAAYNIRPTAGAVANVRQDQTGTTATVRRSILTWYEVTPPANDLCANASTLTSALTCTNTSGTLTGSTYTSIASLGCGPADVNDVWYQFQAQSTNPTITLSSAPANARVQLFSTSCGGTPLGTCATGSSFTPTGLTIGQTYYVRVYSTTNATGSFNICITDPAPANDNCANSVLLTSSTTCNNVSGTVYGATNAAITIGTPNCATGVTYDVWYRFVAQTINPTITLSNIGSSFTNASLQLLSGACGGFTPLFCGGSSLATNHLTPGTTYYIRVYSTGAAPANGVNAGFDICVTDPIATPPSNDECINAINLPLGNGCSNIKGDMAGATASSTPVAPCTGPLGYDVWYKFTAINNSATITISSLGANFTGQRMQLFSGSCGSLSSLACGTTTVTSNTLTPGVVYYVRVYSTNTPAPNGNARFNICAQTTNAPLRFGNSYVNLSKKTTGGVVEKGDTLEIRMTINHTSGTMYRMRYLDNIPSNTAMLAGTGDSIRVITNEGLTFRRYTPNPGVNDDAATYIPSPAAGQYQIRMNLGFGSNPPGAPANNSTTDITGAVGQMNAGSDRPRGGGGMLFATAYRVVVTGDPGQLITLNPGQFIYRTSSNGADITLTSTPYTIQISTPLNLCSNSTGVNNAVEYGGTFGSGTALNRGTDLVTPIAGYSFVNDVSAISDVGDGKYAIVKNLSPKSSTERNARRQNTCNLGPTLSVNDPLNCNNRMFNGFWYIDGDHTGTNNAIGNTPPDDATTGGYMLMVNADFVASEAYRQTITNLCPNTYYEFSAWFRNICPTCGIDSSGTSTYRPGVLPNLTFALDGVDYYNTGEIDTTGWLKKGFVFITGPTQTSVTFTIRNNSQGGGGNDWAMDDIAIATCLPNMTYTPTLNPTVCQLNPITINNTISSYFSNYTHYKWQKSTDGGSNWTDIPGETGSATATQSGGQWEYLISYTVSPTNTTLADSGDMYRVIVATSAANLNDGSCQVTDGVSQIVLSVLTCTPTLGTDFISFTAKHENGLAVLKWTTSAEAEKLQYVIERSTDGRQFVPVGQVKSHEIFSNALNTYNWSEAFSSGTYYYRIKLVDSKNSNKYSRIVAVKATSGSDAASVTNPFYRELVADVRLQTAGIVKLQLIDNNGTVLKTQSTAAAEGLSRITMSNLGGIPAGLYTLKIITPQNMIIKKAIKQ